MTPQEQKDCNEMVEVIQAALYSKYLAIGNVQDLLNMIVESQDIKQSLKDFIENEELE